jgi:hypothetical protein
MVLEVKEKARFPERIERIPEAIVAAPVQADGEVHKWLI